LPDDPDRGLGRSRTELEAARLLAEGGFGPQAVSRAYYAAFYAAQAALSTLGETRSKHAGVLAAFGRRLVREGGLDEASGRLIRLLFERRNDADYRELAVSPEQAREAIDDAERFIKAVTEWLAHR
jgi:uncharacterized protein (UPF0332 family)